MAAFVKKLFVIRKRKRRRRQPENEQNSTSCKEISSATSLFNALLRVCLAGLAFDPDPERRHRHSGLVCVNDMLVRQSARGVRTNDRRERSSLYGLSQLDSR